MRAWREVMNIYLQELGASHGVAPLALNLKCAACGVSEETGSLHRCHSCGPALLCSTCLVKAHQLHPCHFVEVRLFTL